MATSVAEPKQRPGASGPRRRPRRTTRQLIERGVLYTTLLGSLVTAGPLWIDEIKAVSQGISGGSAKAAEQQAKLWQKNIACAAAPYAWFNNPSNIKVDATICDSGDIFVRASTPENGQFFKWVPLSDVVQTKAGGGWFASEANAATMTPRSSSAAAYTPAPTIRFAQAQASVICQKFIDSRHLMRRVQTPQGCFDEVVDTFNGTIVSKTSAPCNPQC